MEVVSEGVVSIDGILLALLEGKRELDLNTVSGFLRFRESSWVVGV